MVQDEQNYWMSTTRQRAFSRRTLLRSAGLGAAGVAGAALLGCGEDEEAPSATATMTAAPGGSASGTAAPSATEAGDAVKRGGIYRDSTQTVAPHFSPYHPGADPSYVNTWRRTNYYDAMWQLTVSDDPEQLVRLSLAESIEHVDDTTVVAKLHRANFHNQPASRSNDKVNGRQLTAEDVVARYEFWQDPATNSSSSAFVTEELTVTALDDLTVEFKMARPFAFFYEANGATGGLRMYEVPQEMLDETILKEDIPIGTGPYMYSSHQLGSREEMVRNPDYWREDVPYLDGRTLTFIPDDAAGEAAFRGGQIEDLQFSNIRQAETVGADLGDEIRTIEFPSVSGMALMANVRRDPWKDERVRRAVHRAINFDRINDVVYFGATTPAWFFSKARPERFPTGREPHMDLIGYDPAEAKALLDAAKADGAYDGREIEYMLPVEAQEWVDAGALVAEDLTAVGFKVRTFTEVRNVYLGLSGPKDLEDMSKPSDFDLTMSVFLDYQYAKTDSGTFWNNASLEDPDVDALVTEIEGTIDAGKRAELSQRFERMLAEKAANFIPILSAQQYHGYYEYVKGVDHELSQSGKLGQQIGYWLDV